MTSYRLTRYLLLPLTVELLLTLQQPLQTAPFQEVCSKGIILFRSIFLCTLLEKVLAHHKCKTYSKYSMANNVLIRLRIFLFTPLSQECISSCLEHTTKWRKDQRWEMFPPECTNRKWGEGANGWTFKTKWLVTLDFDFWYHWPVRRHFPHKSHFLQAF